MRRFVRSAAVWACIVGIAACRSQPTPESAPPSAQHWRPCTSHLRGLSVPAPSIAWASGTNGTVLRTTDGGEHWDVLTIPGADSFDLRDIHAFSAQEALAMTSGGGAFIYRTTDGGAHWNTVYSDTHSAAFLDGLDFDGAFGCCFGDPIDGQFYVLRSQDSGRTWEHLNTLPTPLPQEAGFAASGTGVAVDGRRIAIATGGAAHARLLQSDDGGQTWSAREVPVRSGPQGEGIFSLYSYDQLFVAVGGSYLDSTRADSTVAYSVNAGVDWLIPTPGTRGYRSCVTGGKDTLIASGRSGMDISTDGGKTWSPFHAKGLFSVAICQDVLWGCGRNGQVMRLELKKPAP